MRQILLGLQAFGVNLSTCIVIIVHIAHIAMTWLGFA